MWQRQIFKIFLLGIICLSLLKQPVAAEAKETFSFTISPSIQEFDLQPGASASFKIKLVNSSDWPMPIAIQSLNYSQDSQGNPVYHNQDNLPDQDAASWINTTAIQTILDQQGSKKIKFKVEIPQTVKNGSYIAAIMFKPVPPQAYFDLYSSPTLGYISALVVININSDQLKDGQIIVQEFKKSSPDQQQLLVGLKNTSDYYQKTSTQITVHNIFGSVIKSATYNDMTILPNKIRYYTSNLEKLGPGIYTVELSGQNLKYQTAQKLHLLILPDRTAIWALIPLCIILIFIGYQKKYRQKKRP